jgi:hypothetical protein
MLCEGMEDVYGSLNKKYETRIYRVSQELRSVLRDLIPELMLRQKRHIHVGPFRIGSEVTSFKSTANKLERKEEHCVFIDICF